MDTESTPNKVAKKDTIKRRSDIITDNGTPSKAARLNSDSQDQQPGSSSTQIQSYKEQQKSFVKLNR